MHVPRPQCWGDEAAQKNVYRDAVRNGTARSPAFMHGVCTPNGVASHAWHITAAYICSPPVTHHQSVHDHTRRELFLKDIQAMSDKKLMLLLHRVRRYVSYHLHIIGCPLCCRHTCIPSYMICSQPSVTLDVCRPSIGPCIRRRDFISRRSTARSRIVDRP